MARAKRQLSASQYVAIAELPSSPSVGQTAFKGGILYIYTLLGGLETWVPLNRPQSSYVHSQGVAQTTWTIYHGLGTKDVIVALYDNTNMVIDAQIQQLEDGVTGEWYTEVILSEAMVGYAVIFGIEELNVESAAVENLVVSGTATVGGSPVITSQDLTALLAQKLDIDGTAVNSDALGGIAAADYINVNDLVDLGSLP